MAAAKHSIDAEGTGEEVALLSVTHPILGTWLEVGQHCIRIGPEQYLALVDELCNIAFLAPHLASRVQTLARELKVPEVAQYVAWLREADRNAASRLIGVAQEEDTSQRHSTADTQTAPALSANKKGQGHAKRTWVDRADRAGDVARGDDLAGSRASAAKRMAHTIAAGP
jgi:hypothetical protein